MFSDEKHIHFNRVLSSYFSLCTKPFMERSHFLQLKILHQMTYGSVNAHLRSDAYTDKTCLNIMVFNPSAGADEAPWAIFFFQNNQYSVHLPIFPSNDISTVIPIQMHGQPMLTLP